MQLKHNDLSGNSRYSKAGIGHMAMKCLKVPLEDF